MAGLYFEDFREGQVFEHALSRTVTEMDNVLFRVPSREWLKLGVV
jgi:acyl dehydratase